MNVCALLVVSATEAAFEGINSCHNSEAGFIANLNPHPTEAHVCLALEQFLNKG